MHGCMARPLRIEGEGCVYHLTARGDRRQAIFRDDTDRGRFRERMVESLERYKVELHAWVLMGNHFHLLARTRDANLSRWMQWLLGVYTMDFNRRHQQCGHVFQGRFKSFLVEERGYFAELGRYIHLNPVRGVALGRGEVKERRARLRAWEWSSYCAYAGLAAAPQWLHRSAAYGELGLERAKDRCLCYRRFVERGLAQGIRDPREMAESQAVLGSEEFVQRVKDRLRAAREGRSFAQVTTGGILRTAEVGQQVIEEIAAREGLTEEEFCGGRRYGDRAKTEAMDRLRKEAGWTLREIGQRFGGMRPGAVAQRLHQSKTDAE